MEEQEYIYDAFISYRHTALDKAIADKLQKLLERYVPPASVTGGKKPKKLRIFRDETELPTSSNLSDDISNALKNSRFLIVLCSKTTKDSKWCMQEITQFKALHGGTTSNILTLLTEGEPAEVFPKELCTETRTYMDADGKEYTEIVDVEPLAGNVSAPTLNESLRKLRREFLRIAAPLYNCGFDALYNRNQRRFIRRVVTVGAAAIAFLIAFGIYSSIMIVKISDQRDEIDLRRQEAETNLNYALEQEALARQNQELAEAQEALAVENLNYAKDLLLSNAIDYASDLNAQGARSRASAVLKKVYESIKPDSEQADALRTKFRDTVINTMYYGDETLPFAKIDLRSEILQIEEMPETGTAAVMTASQIYLLDMTTGDVLGSYGLPDNASPGTDSFSAVGVYDRFVLAVTGSGYVMTIDTQSGEQSTTMGGGNARYYESDVIEAIAYNEAISAITILTTASGRFAEEPEQWDTYVEGDELELYTKVMLTVMACDIFGAGITDTQTITFKADTSIDFDPVRISENVRYIALRHNFKTYSTGNGFEGHTVNSDIILIDINKYDPSLTAVQNREAMATVIDCRFDGEQDFYFRDFAVSDRGFLTLEGISDTNGSSSRPGARHKVVVYDSKSGEVVWNEKMTGLTGYSGSRLLPIVNGYYLEEELHWLSNGESIAAISPDEPDYEEWVEEKRREWGPLITDRLTLFSARSEDWMAYVEANEDGQVLKLFDLRDGGELFAEHELPDGFKPESCYFYSVDTYDAFIFVHPHLLISGTQYGDSKNLLIKNPLFGMGGDYNGEFQTLDTLTTSVAVDLERGVMITGYKDGKVLMFNHGATPSIEFCPDYEPDDDDLPFTLEEDRSDYRNYVYRVIDNATGEVLYTYELPVEVNLTWDINRRDGIFSGIGDEPDKIWFFFEETLVLRVIDLSSGEIVSEESIAERVEEDTASALGPIGGVATLSDVVYSIGGDLVVFIGSGGSMDAVYSLTSGAMVFTGAITAAQPDCSAIYIGYDKERVPLTREELYETLVQHPYAATLTDEDIDATGLAVFG